jgi:hypothetical protein
LSEFDHFFVEADKDNEENYDDVFKETDQEKLKLEKLQREVIQLRREVNAANGKDKKEEYEAKLKLLKAEANDFEKYKDPDGKDMFPEVERHEANKRLKTQAEWQKLQQEIKKLEADLDVDENGSTYGSEVANRRSKLKADVIKAASDAAHAEQRFEMEKRRGARDLMAKAPEVMDESKINKLNTLKPLMMKCQVRVSNPSGEVTEYPMELVLGVKCHCRLIDAETLPEVAKYPIKEMNELTRKVKYKAGELKFFKDIVFNIKEKKQSAIDNKDPKKRWYRRLYKLAHMKGDSFVSGSISGNKRSGLIPNATMIITNSDVENVKAATDIDLLKGSTAKKFCDELFLMAIVVIDQDRESVKMLQPDTHSDYEVHSIAAIKKKLAELDTVGTKTRDMFKLLG